MKFVPKRELRPACVTWTVIGFLMFAGVIGLIDSEGGGLVQKFVAIIILITAGLLIWIWTATSYVLGDEHLVFRAGPIVKRIPYRKLTRARRVRSVLFSLFATHHIELTAGRYDSYQVVPLQEERFMGELCERCPQLIVEQTVANKVS
ncbi:PH domain-containing protein [Paenibacillaceae bacterium GAS479]|nr:PH domain-containing protein [Paenibacillaceae bacterium GAS479]